MPHLIDAFDFTRTPKHELGRARRAIAEELRADLGDRTWDDHEECDAVELHDGLTIIDEAEFDSRYRSAESSLPAPTQEQILMLKKLGYAVEDMGEVHGPGWWEGQYRWTRDAAGEFQDHDTSCSEADAWAQALDHAMRAP